MKEIYRRVIHAPGLVRRDQRGITGLETAIILIAFVVVASVFAFAVLSTGLLSSEKAKEAAIGGLEATSSTLSLRGSVTAVTNSDLDAINTIKFELTSAADAASSVDLSALGTIISYIDKDQERNIAAADWQATWLIGTGPLVDPGEAVDVEVTLTGLSTLLGTRKEFTIQVKPNRGAVIIINRTTPPEFTTVLDLF